MLFHLDIIANEVIDSVGFFEYKSDWTVCLSSVSFHTTIRSSTLHISNDFPRCYFSLDENSMIFFVGCVCI